MKNMDAMVLAVVRAWARAGHAARRGTSCSPSPPTRRTAPPTAPASSPPSTPSSSRAAPRASASPAPTPSTPTTGCGSTRSRPASAAPRWLKLTARGQGRARLEGQPRRTPSPAGRRRRPDRRAPLAGPAHPHRAGRRSPNSPRSTASPPTSTTSTRCSTGSAPPPPSSSRPSATAPTRRCCRPVTRSTSSPAPPPPYVDGRDPARRRGGVPRHHGPAHRARTCDWEYHHREVAARGPGRLGVRSPRCARPLEHFDPDGARRAVLHVGRHRRQAVLPARHHRLRLLAAEAAGRASTTRRSSTAWTSASRSTRCTSASACWTVSCAGPPSASRRPAGDRQPRSRTPATAAGRPRSTRAIAAAHDGSPDYVGVVGDEVWWTAPRPAEGGRRALIRRRADGTEECRRCPRRGTSATASWSTAAPPGPARVVDGAPLIVFTHHADQRLYAFAPDAPAGRRRVRSPRSPRVGGGLRWARPAVLRRSAARCGACWRSSPARRPTDVRRVHRRRPARRLAPPRTAPPCANWPRPRTASSPVRGSRPDGRQAVWLAWDHPRMPWDGTELRCADVRADGTFGPARHARRRARGVRRPGRVGRRRHPARRHRPHRLVEPAPRRPGRPAKPSTCARARRSSAGRCGSSGSAGSRPLDHGLVAVLHGRGAASARRCSTPRPASSPTPPGRGPSGSATLAVTGSRVVGVAASVRRLARDRRTRHRHRPHPGPRRPPTTTPSTPPTTRRPQARVFTGPGGREVHAHVYAAAPPRPARSGR